MEDNKVSESVGNDSLKNITSVIKGVAGNFGESGEVGNGGNTGNNENCGEGLPGTAFKVASTNLPEKTGFWTKVKNALLYDVTIELTPYQQKIEDEINDFLHQEVTWQSFKNFLFQEVPITYKGKRIF